LRRIRTKVKIAKEASHASEEAKLAAAQLEAARVQDMYREQQLLAKNELIVQREIATQRARDAKIEHERQRQVSLDDFHRRRNAFNAKIPRRMQLFQMKDAAVVVEQTKAKERRRLVNPLKDELLAKIADTEQALKWVDFTRNKNVEIEKLWRSTDLGVEVLQTAARFKLRGR